MIKRYGKFVLTSTFDMTEIKEELSEKKVAEATKKKKEPLKVQIEKHNKKVNESRKVIEKSEGQDVSQQ